MPIYAMVICKLMCVGWYQFGREIWLEKWPIFVHIGKDTGVCLSRVRDTASSTSVCLDRVTSTSRREIHHEYGPVLEVTPTDKRQVPRISEYGNV